MASGGWLSEEQADYYLEQSETMVTDRLDNT
jgi:hypothetical protein